MFSKHSPGYPILGCIRGSWLVGLCISAQGAVSSTDSFTALTDVWATKTEATGCWSEACSEGKEQGRGTWTGCTRVAELLVSVTLSLVRTILHSEGSRMFRCLCQNHWPLPSEAIELHLMVVSSHAAVNLHDREYVITFTARDESLSGWKDIAALLPSQGRDLDDQLIIAILILICF